jgi:pimeloyl-ACP methyl ester carboxylesterase
MGRRTHQGAGGSRRRGRSRRLLLRGLAGGVVVATGALGLRYRKELGAARSRLAHVDRRAVRTHWGSVEYAERGCGEPLLVLHGIFGGCDEGVRAGRDVFRDRRVIAPSRFGYLGSALPPDATPADQADALAALLDALGIGEIDVVGISAGATSALQLALRHPDKVKHLAILVGNLPGSPTAVAQPAWAKLLDRQLPIWLLKTLLPGVMARLAGVPRSFALTGDDARFVTEFLDGMFPLTPRLKGVIFDAFVSNPDVDACDLESIAVPTLVAHTRDDPLASHEASRRAADRIPGARFVSLESGGHLMLGQTKLVHDALAAFFAERSAPHAHIERSADDRAGLAGPG